MKRGTPKTLNQAIINGLEDYGFQNTEKLAQFIEPHIKDFLAQKFNVSMMKQSDDKLSDDIKALFEKITKVAA